MVEHAINGTLSLLQGRWKYIEPSKGPAISAYTNIETGYHAGPQLYDLTTDVAERNNLAQSQPAVTEQMKAQLQQIRQQDPRQR